MRSIPTVILLVVTWGCTTETVQQQSQLSGEELYARNCAGCHGPSAEGDGPLARVMTINVPNLRALSERSKGSFPREAVEQYIDGRRQADAHGDRYMPIWGLEFRLMEGDDRAAEQAAQARIEALTDFIVSIQY